MLNVKLLSPSATLPTVAHEGEDLGYDIYASEDCWLYRHQMSRVPTGIAVQCGSGPIGEPWTYPYGLLIKDRSSMAGKGVHTSGGVLDSGYRGEIFVSMTTINAAPYLIEQGAKIAQMVPIQVLTGKVLEVKDLPDSSRGNKGFGSSGK